MKAERRSDAQKGGKGDEPRNVALWLKDLEHRLDEEWQRRRIERSMMAKTEEIDVDDILDELDEEEIEDAEELDADDDPTVEVKAKKTRTRKTKTAKTRKPKVERSGIGTVELAEAAGTDPRALRVLLRAEFPREEGGRYNWKSLNDPEAKAIIKRVRSGGAKDAQAAKLDSLKKGKKGKAKKTSAKSSKKGAKTKAQRAKERRERKAKEAEE